MKNLLLLALLAMFVFACNSDDSKNSENTEENSGNTETTEQESSSTGEKKYEIEEGFVKYKMSMMGMDTEVNLYFKDYGRMEATVTKAEMMGQKMTTNTLQKGGYIYSYTDLTDKGAKVKLDGEGSEGGETPKMDVAAIKAMGGTEIASEEFAGKKCTVFELEKDGAKSKFWIWKNILLKMTAEQQGMVVTMEATEVQESPSFPDGTFELPSNIEFTEQNLDADFEDTDAKG